VMLAECSHTDFPPLPAAQASPPQGGRLGAALNLPPCGGSEGRARPVARPGKAAPLRGGGGKSAAEQPFRNQSAPA
jgi:hypothetical protein